MAEKITILKGTGIGTKYPAATDIAKESGRTMFGGVELISDPRDPNYIGHGIGHRDPKTGVPVRFSVHIPTRGEVHPNEFVGMADDSGNNALVTNAQLLQEKFGVTAPSKYMANLIKAKSYANFGFSKVLHSRSLLERALVQRERAALELAAYNDMNGGFTFAKT